MGARRARVNRRVSHLVRYQLTRWHPIFGCAATGHARLALSLEAVQPSLPSGLAEGGEGSPNQGAPGDKRT